MKGVIPLISLTLLIFAGVFLVQAQSKEKPRVVDPVVNFKLTLPQASTIIYAIRYTTILDGKSANELADLLVKQANDTTLNKPLVSATKQK